MIASLKRYRDFELFLIPYFRISSSQKVFGISCQSYKAYTNYVMDLAKKLFMKYMTVYLSYCQIQSSMTVSLVIIQSSDPIIVRVNGYAQVTPRKVLSIFTDKSHFQNRPSKLLFFVDNYRARTLCHHQVQFTDRFYDSFSKSYLFFRF